MSSLISYIIKINQLIRRMFKPLQTLVKIMSSETKKSDAGSRIAYAFAPGYFTLAFMYIFSRSTK